MKSRPGVKLFQVALGYLAGERFVRMLVGFFVHTLVVRYLGPSDYGVYGYAVSFYAIFQPFVNYGAEDVYLKDIIQHKNNEKTSEILGSGLCYKLICSFISYFVMVGSLYFVGVKDWQTISLILILGLYSFFNSFSIFEIFLQSKMDFKSISLSRLIGYLVSSGLKVLIVVLELPMVWLATVFVLEIVIGRMIVFYKVRGNLPKLHVSQQYMKKFLTNTWPFMITVVVIGVAHKSGVFFLKEYSSLEEVGIFTVMLTLVRFMHFIPVAILTSIIPKIIETKSRDYGQYKYRLSAIYFSMVGLVFGMFCFFYIFSDYIVYLFYGKEFSHLAEILPWGVLATMTTYVNLSKAKHFLLEEMNKEWLIYNLGSMVCVLILQFLLVPQYKIYGALAAYCGGYFVFDIIFCIVNKKYRKIFKIFLRSPLFPVKFIAKRVLK